jgi:polysaccharide deacetylase 2 family uncharacterized protein YibQ
LRTARRLISGSIVLSLLAGFGAVAQEPRIAVIIDDIGHRLDAGRRSISLPGPVTLAILPYTPFARRLAEEARAGGKDVLVHLPMQASSLLADPGPGTLTLGQDRSAIGTTLARALAAVPHAIGVSNHMGSLLTRDPLAMHDFMESLANQPGLIFIDSYTTHLSVGLMTAREFGIPALKRDVFLDADLSAAGIEAAWQSLLEQARTHGFAIGIAHPNSAMLEILERNISTLQDVAVVALEDLLDGESTQRSYAELIGRAPTGDFLTAHRAH